MSKNPEGSSKGSRRLFYVLLPLTLAVVVLVLALQAVGQDGGQESDEGGSNLAGLPVTPDPADPSPAAPSVGASVPLSYFGPFPSEVKKELVGPVELLRSGSIDPRAGTVTLPLYRGQMEDGKNVWYILTDTTDRDNAESLGLNFAGKLLYADVGRATRRAKLQKNGTLTFESGSVDFSPNRRVVPGGVAKPFPPKTAEPGSVGDKNYTPLIRIENAGNHIYNAPVIAFDVDGDDLKFCNRPPNHNVVHDRVVKICPSGDKNGGGTVTLATTPIFSFAKPALYISMDASDPMVATLDNGTHAPALADLPVGGDDSAFSAVERLFVVANGPTGATNPQRQGLSSALTDKGPDEKPLPPLNVIGGIPTVALDYSPMWDLNLGQWTQKAIQMDYRARINDEFQFLDMARRGWITGPDGKRFGSTGIVVNCPIVMRLL